MSIRYQRVTHSDGHTEIVAIDSATGKVLFSGEDAYNVAVEKNRAHKLYMKGKTLDPNEFDKAATYAHEDKVLRQQIALDRELTEYMRGGHNPTSSMGQQLVYALQQKFPSNLGWEMLPGLSVSDMKRYVGQVGVVMRNNLTGEVRLVDTHYPSKSKMLNHTHMNFLLNAYRQQHPGENVQGIYQYDPFSYSLQKGKASPGGMKKYYGIGNGGSGFFHNLDQEAIDSATLDTSKGFFKKGDPSRKYIKTIVDLDTETEDTKNGGIGRPVEISGKKFGLLPDGTLELIDTFEEYYQGRFGGAASAVHGYNSAIIDKLQGLTGQLKGEHYATGAKQRLLKFIGDSVVVGHNIVNFDFHALRLTYDEIKQLEQNGIVDTLQVTRNIRGFIDDSGHPVKNDLQSLFKEKFGKTTEDMGIRAHGAGGDTTTEMLWLSQEMADETEVGKVLRGLLTSRFHLSTHVASSGSAADALGYAYYDERGNEYTAEEIITLGMIASGGKIGTGGGSLMDTNIVGVMQQLEETISQLAAAVNATTNDWKHANQATENEYRNLSETIAAGHVGEIRRLATDARKMFPGDYAAQQEYVTNFAGASEPVRNSALQNLIHLQRIDEKNDFKSRYGVTMADAKAAGGIWKLDKEAQAPRWIPFTMDDNGNWTMGGQERKTASYEGLFGEINQIKRDAETLAIDEIKRGEAGAKIIRKLGRGAYPYLEEAKANAEGFRRDAEMQIGGMFLEDIVKQNSAYMDAQNKHIQNMEKEASLWEKIDENAVKAAFSTANVIAGAIVPHAQLSSVISAGGQQAGSISSSLDWLPFSKKPLHRLAAAFNNSTSAIAAKLDYKQSQIDTAANTVANVGSAVGGGLMVVNPIVGAAVSGGSALAGTVISGVGGGGWKTKKATEIITEKGQRLSESFNLFGMAFELVRAPFSLLNNTLRGTLNLFTKFNKLMAIFNGMGLPYTSLTGVTFAAYDRTTLTDRGLGLQLGSVNNSLNSWANAQQGLFTMGQMDQNRVIASALLGVFDNVYANGGDTQTQRASTIDKLANDIITDPSRAQAIMTQAGMIDSTMPAELQMAVNMKRAGYISSYSDMGKSSTWGITGASDATKNAWQPRMYAARFGWGSAVQEATFVGRQVATIAWEKLGKPVTNVLIKSGQEIVDAYNTGGWDAMIEKIKELAKSGFKWVKEKLGMDEDAEVGDVVSNLWTRVKKAFTTYAAPVFDHIVGLWLGLVKKVGTSLASVIGEMSTWRINTKAILGRALKNEAINPYKDYIDDPIIYNEDPNKYNSTTTAQLNKPWQDKMWNGLWENVADSAKMGVTKSAIRNIIGNSASTESAMIALGKMIKETGGEEEWIKALNKNGYDGAQLYQMEGLIQDAVKANDEAVRSKQNIVDTTTELLNSLTDFTVQAVNIVKLSINGGPEKTVYIKDGKAYDAETDLEVELTVTNEVNKKASGGGN